MYFRERDYLTKDRIWHSSPGGQPLLLTFESVGLGEDYEADIAWAIKGSAVDLGRYRFCPHLNTTLELINKSLQVNDGIGMGGEALLTDLNERMVATRYSLGGCAVKAFQPIISGVLEYQANRDQ